jgi:hypothetical protein
MFDLLIRALLHYRAIHLRRPCIAVPFMLLFNPCLLYMQLCIFRVRASAPPPIASPVITIQAMSKIHSPSYVIYPTLQYHVCPLLSRENVCIVCFFVSSGSIRVSVAAWKRVVMYLSPPFDGGGAAGPGSRTAASLAPSYCSHPCVFVWLI